MTAGGDAPIRRLSSRLVYANPYLRLREDAIEQPDGTRGIYSVVEKPDFALVVPFDGQRVHLVGQYRYPVGSFEWEFPQGGVEVTHAGTARREDGRIVTAGGRVLNVTALGRDAAAARDAAYAAADLITFEGRQLRRDIARRTVGRT